MQEVYMSTDSKVGMDGVEDLQAVDEAKDATFGPTTSLHLADIISCLLELSHHATNLWCFTIPCRLNRVFLRHEEALLRKCFVTITRLQGDYKLRGRPA
jgi:hypothetical protein